MSWAETTYNVHVGVHLYKRSFYENVCVEML
jgi:hypothetical protein